VTRRGLSRQSITITCLDVDTTADMFGELAAAPTAALRW
jgi:hypothetical protein